MNRLLFLFAAPTVALFAVQSGAQVEYVNAGVLPYSTATGEVTVLLGFDAGEGHWSDFVGTCTPGETPAQTAARQFEEETRGGYQISDISQRLQGVAPIEIGNTRIFLIEVPQVSARQLERLSKDRGFEKTDYCWVPLLELLESIDDRGPNRARVPESCIADSHDLYELVGRNLRQGQETRRRLLSPDQGASVTNLGLSPRCGR